MDMRCDYEVFVKVRIGGEHLDLVRDPETTASAIRGVVAEALPFLVVKKVKARRSR
ncbi:MAG: hypothetical protein N3H32_04265 [Nitrososphaeria archaeon]|nr:hypothetical protein [Nitrososphaeria archaeon]